MKRERTILVADDEQRFRELLHDALAQAGYRVVTAADGAAALALLDDGVDLVVSDLKMPGMDGLELLAEARRRFPALPVIVMTAFATVGTAVEAMRRGAFDYITKPFDLDELEMLARRAFDLDNLASENRFLREDSRAGFGRMIGRSAPMQALFSEIEAVAASPAPLLIHGETGTGKELVARAVHDHGPRASGLFVAINCAAIPSELLESELFGHVRGAFTGAVETRIGKLELASGGTLFLDEIGDMPLALQAKLLRVLEQGSLERLGSNREIRIDVRVVSATHRSLAALVAEGRFREDLVYRLNVLAIEVPPLRERPGDVALLAAHFLAASAARAGRPAPRVEREALDLLESYPWPGNVRELRNVCERLAVRGGDRIGGDGVAHLLDLPEAHGEAAPGEAPLSLAAAVARAEAEAINTALARSGDNKARAARLLGISERNLWYKLKRHGLTRGRPDE